MDLSTYRKFNENFYKLSEKNALRLEACCQIRKLNKGDKFSEIGQICRWTGLVTKGLLRSYLYVDEIECTYEFFSEFSYVTDYESLSLQKSATFTIEALEDSELICLNALDLNKLYQESLEYHLLVKAIMEKRFQEMLNLSRALRFQNPQKRYETFLQHFPTVPNRVPQYMIASYLGITPETLSRVRNRLSKHK